MSFNWPIGPPRRPDDYVSDDEVSYDGKWDDWESDISTHMEEDGVSTFPSCKPDRDVFWSQSGWYQIKRRYALPYIPPSFDVVAATASCTYTPAAPASIPLELHDLLADSFALQPGIFDKLPPSQVSDTWSGRNHTFIDKHEMNHCALVCSSWAMKCQPHLFNTVTLRSRQDLNTLLGFLKSTVSRISQYIQYIEIPEQRLDVPPWLHLVSHLYPKLRCEQFTLSFHLRGPLHAKYRTMRSIHYLLPRTNPSTASLNVTSLSLQDISLHSLGDLIQAVGEMPQLNHMTCTAVAWEMIPRVRTSMKIAANSARRFMMRTTGCTDNIVAVWLFAALRHQRQESPSEDLELMHNLTELLIPAIAADSDAVVPLTMTVHNNIVRSGERIDIGELAQCR